MTAIPVTLITGFLGSGKTTLLNNLLRDPGMADTAVIINEFGDVAIDHLLVESAIENAVVLQSGCICCTVRGDLVDTLSDLTAKQQRGEIPAFSRIAIETTGLADPTSIVQIFTTEELVSSQFRLRAVVTTVDAVNASGQLDQFEEAAHQVAMADVIILTKTDLSDEGASAALRQRIKRINPGAEIVPVMHGKLSPEDLFERAPQTPLASGEGLANWLKPDAFDHHHHDHDHHHDHGHHHHDGDGHSHHDAAITSFAVTLDQPIEREALNSWLNAVLSLRGKDLLRMKGIVNVRGLPGPMVVHAVQNIVHPPVRLMRWPSADHTTRIVFITRNISRAALQNSLEALAGAQAASAK